MCDCAMTYSDDDGWARSYIVGDIDVHLDVGGVVAKVRDGL